MKITQYILIILFLTHSISLSACSCSSIKIVNAFSNLNFIGIVEFESIKRIENSYGLYESKINIKELFKGNRKEKLYINSQEGSSCSFLPKKNEEYLILGYKNKNGLIETSFCLAYNVPNKQKLSILRELAEKNSTKGIASNLRQILKAEIDYKLFKKSVNGIFLYKVILNSDLTIENVIPKNKNAKRNYNAKVRKELISKIIFIKTEEGTNVKNKNLTSYIILNWYVNHQNKRIITATKL